jgi:dTDP-4-dehydrorhamnose reductase
MKRLLITGGSSYLGQALVPLALARYELCYTYFSHDPLAMPHGQPLDIRDGEAVRRLASLWRPDVVIHLAGSNRSPAMEEVIRQGARHVTAAAAEWGARLIHLSTDSIFDGRQPPYRESDQPSPLHAYGQAKADAEASVARYDNHVIVRTSLIYSRTRMDRSTEWIVAALQAGKPVTLFTDQRRNPVWDETLSLACLEVAEIDYRGILNVAGRQVFSRAEFGLKLLDWWGVDERKKLRLGPSPTGAWPLDCRFDLSLAKALLKTALLGVDDVLTAPASTGNGAPAVDQSRA